MEVPLQRLERRWSGEGIVVWGTNWADRMVLEFEAAEACEAALQIQELLKRHALGSSFMERLDDRSFLVRALEPLPFQVVVESAAPGESTLTYQTDLGAISREEALGTEGINPKRLEMMEDVATHAGRSLRAHLSLHGVEHLRLPMRFGVAADGSCLPEVINPLSADLGMTDMAELVKVLGG